MNTGISEARGHRVLLIEDEYFIAVDVARAFKARGLEVVGPVGTVDAAMQLMDKAGHLDGAVLDINLQGEVVYPLADALQQRGVPFIFATGYDATMIPARFAEVRRCEKPVDPGRIATLLFGAP